MKRALGILVGVAVTGLFLGMVLLGAGSWRRAMAPRPPPPEDPALRVHFFSARPDARADAPRRDAGARLRD